MIRGTLTLSTCGVLVALTLGGCGNNKRSNSFSTATAPTTSASTNPTVSGTAIVPATSTVIKESGHGTIGIGQSATGGTVHWILRDDGKEFEVVNPADLVAANVKQGDGLTFEGEIVPNFTTTRGDPLNLDSFTMDPAKPKPTRPRLPVFKPGPWILRHDMTPELYQARVTAYWKKGFKPLSVSVRGSTKKPRFTAIWIKDKAQRAARHGFTSEGYQAQFSKLAKSGYRPLSVSAYGKYPNERYAATFVKSKLPFVARHRMTTKSYQAEFDKLAKLGFRPVWISAIGPSPKKARFAAIWVKSKADFAAVHDRKEKEFKATLAGMSKKGYRPISLAKYGAPLPLLFMQPRWAGIWVKSKLRNRIFVNQKAKDYQATATRMAKLGYRPVTVIADAFNRYSSTWVKLGKATNNPFLGAIVSAIAKAKAKANPKPKKSGGFFASLLNSIKAAKKAKSSSSSSSSGGSFSASFSFGISPLSKAGMNTIGNSTNP